MGVMKPLEDLLGLAMTRCQHLPIDSQVKLTGVLSEVLGIKTIADLNAALKEEK